MPITVELRDESGKVLERTGEHSGAVPGYFPDFEDGQFLTIRYIDRYGDTVFNRLQMTPVISELCALRELARNDVQRRVVDQTIALARKC